MNSWRGTVDAPISLRRSYTHTAEKWPQRNLDSGSKLCHHALAVEWNDFDLAIRKIFGQESASRREGVICVWNGQIDLLDAHFECVSRFGLLDVHRPVQDVPARSSV